MREGGGMEPPGRKQTAHTMQIVCLGLHLPHTHTNKIQKGLALESDREQNAKQWQQWENQKTNFYPQEMMLKPLVMLPMFYLIQKVQKNLKKNEYIYVCVCVDLCN